MVFKRFHLAADHYFPEGKFKEVAFPSAEDLEPGKLLPNDLMGKVYKLVSQRSGKGGQAGWDKIPSLAERI